VLKHDRLRVPNEGVLCLDAVRALFAATRRAVASAAIRVKPRLYLVGLAAEPSRRHDDADANEPALGFANR